MSVFLRFLSIHLLVDLIYFIHFLVYSYLIFVCLLLRTPRSERNFNLIFALISVHNTVQLFSILGNEIESTSHHFDNDEGRKRSYSEGGGGSYEKKRKQQRKNSISSCAGFPSTSDFGSLDADSVSNDFEVILYSIFYIHLIPVIYFASI